jgi:antitoxin (DNA-binding transcriptional repressor) of toxin-antitoxin stability system
MRRVNIANLKNDLSRHLRHVRAGGDVVVLDRDTPVARIVPFSRAVGAGSRGARTDDYWDAARIAALERGGILSRPDSPSPAGWARTLRAAKLPKGTPGAVEGLLQARRESRR